MIACLYFPDFPAIAARWAMRAKEEVAVERNGRIVAATHGARRAGIDTGMHVDRASALMPSVVIATRNEATEQGVWDVVVEHVFGITPYLQTSTRGELYCEPFASRQMLQLARSMQAQIGIAPTFTLALLASHEALMASITTVHDDDIASFLSTWKVDHLLAMGYTEELVERLKLFGLITITHLQHLTEHHYRVQFGVEGRRLYRLVRSIPVRRALPLYTPPAVLISRQCFDDRQREPSMLEGALHQALDDVLAQLPPRRATIIEVAMLDKADDVVAKRVRILKTDTHAAGMRMVARILLVELMSSCRWCYGIEVQLKGLAPPVQEQIALFRERPTATAVAHAVLRRYPRGVLRITHINTQAYLPEKAAQFTPYEDSSRHD